jgi:alanine dehydrogenase
MIFGLLRDIKEGEYRVICTPTEVATIAAAGHTVLAQKDCGKAAGFSNEAYEKAGAEWRPCIHQNILLNHVFLILYFHF